MRETKHNLIWQSKDTKRSKVSGGIKVNKKNRENVQDYIK